MRNAFAHETLEAQPEAPSRPPRAHSLARALFAIEELPLDPEAPPARRGPGVLGLLVARERLPEEPVAPPAPRRHRWLSWLLRPESLDPP